MEGGKLTTDNNNKHRKKSSTRTSLSEPDLTTAEKTRYNTGFPPGTTVDELFHYRKKKQLAFLQIHDNLRADEGSYNKIKSEYKRQFRDDIYQTIQEVPRVKAIRPEDSFKVEGSLELKPEYYESFIEYPIEKSIVHRPKDLINGIGMEIADEEEKTDGEQEEEEDKSEEKQPQSRVGRHYLFKRPTNLKLEGDFYAETENAEKFIHYLLTGRPDLTRKPTTLKLEGEMETKTETSEKYVPFEYQSRRPLFRKSTNLHLEGVLDITTETREKYLPYEVQQRAPLTKRGTNLHLEGDLKLQPEYKDVFVKYKEAERPKPKLPVNNLKTEGCFESQTEKMEKFVEHQIHPVIPFLRGVDVSSRKLVLGDDTNVKRAEYREKFTEYPKIERSFQHKPKANLKPEGDMEIITENKTEFVHKPVSRTEMRRAANNLQLEGNIDMNPEYRNAYVNFYRDAYGKFGVKKNEDEPEKRRRRTVSHPATNLKTEGVMETNPEYKSSFVDFPRHRPSVKKPETHLRSEGNLSNMTEKRAHYIEHPKGLKAKPLKRQTELKLEGPFECQPEYRRAYIDYITREKVERLRPSDNLGIQQPKRVFDILEDNIPLLSPQPPPTPIPEEKNENAAESETTTDGSTPLPETKSKLSVPTAPRKSSLSPVSKASSKKVNKENLSKMENCLFGPKVPNPSGRNRRNISPANENAKRLTMEERARIARARRRYGSPVMVENLAYTPRTSPVQAILQASARSRWKHKDDKKDGQAFVVLSSLEDGCNKDSDSCTPCDRNQIRHAHNELYKEQKWMPSWYAPPSKQK